MPSDPQAPGRSGFHSAARPEDRATGGGWRGWRNRLLGSRRFQSLAARLPFTRNKTRREGERLFDLVSGFVHSQVLQAVVHLDLLAELRDCPARAAALGLRHAIAPERMEALLQAAAALGLLERLGDGRYQTAPLGAAALGVPGLADMIGHHAILYRDLADPVAFLREETETELARFWPYVFGAGAAADPATAERYSELMAESQILVAEDTLDAAPLRGVGHLMDVGGGTGAFLVAVRERYPRLGLTLFDLPAVTAAARRRIERVSPGAEIQVLSGSFRDDALPRGADAISLVRVLYDHGDDTAQALLRAVHDALPPGGQVIVSEPMAGGARPNRAGDAYFALYTMAMRTGRTRSPEMLSAMLREAGFTGLRAPRPRRPFVTSVLVATRGA